MFEDLSTCLLREDEEKLVFAHKDDQETIVAKEKDFFTKLDNEEVEENINVINKIPIINKEVVII